MHVAAPHRPTTIRRMNDAQPSRISQATAGVIALLLAAMLWSLNGPLIKLANQATGDAAGAHGLTIACYRSLIGGALFLIPGFLNRRSLAVVAPRWPIASVIAFTLMTACFVVATTMTAAANAIVLQYVSPLVVFLLSPLILSERPRWSEGVVLLLSMVGVAIIFIGNGGSQTAALTLALLAGAGYGALTVILRGLRGVHATTVVAMNFIGSGLLLLPVVLAMGIAEVPPKQLAVIALMAAVQFSLPYAIFQWGLQRVEAYKASLITLLEPVLNPVLTLLIVGEAIPPATLIGGPIILASVLGWLILSSRNARRT